MSEKLYAERDIEELDSIGGYYCRHISAMTKEGLHNKTDIAAELGFRDAEIDRLKRELAEARAELASYKVGVEAWVGTEHLHYIDCQCYWCRGEEKNEHQRVKVLVRAKDGLL